MNYDAWKLEEEPTQVNECQECGASCELEFCSTSCYYANQI